MLSINTNLSSLIAQSSMKQSTNKLNQAIERMTTGFKINHSSDNAANYSISTNMTTKINSYMVAEDNALQGLDLLTTAEENLDLINSHVQRLRDLAEQANNGTYGEQSLRAINAEANSIVDEINRIYENAEYNGLKLFQTAKTEMENPIATISEPISTFSLRSTTSSSSTGFINEITQRDTSGMTKLSSVDASTTISSGTYSISTVEDLKKLAIMTNAGLITGGEFVLANDIDLSEVDNWTPIGASGDFWDESTAWKATFDGNGYVISNLNIVSDGTCVVNGLFGTISTGASIKNLGIENSTVDGNGKGAAGILVAGICDSTYTLITIENCYTTGNVLDGVYSGGIVGAAVQGKVDITNCYSTADVVSNIDSNDAVTSVGGILGTSYVCGLTVENCYTTGNMVLNNSKDVANVGGLVGLTYLWNNDSTFGTTYITNSFALGNVSGSATGSESEVSVGGLVGSLNEGYDACIINCYYNSANALGVGRYYNSYSLTLTAKTASELQAMIPTLYDYPSEPSDGEADENDSIIPPSPSPNIAPDIIYLQVGGNSQIAVNIKFSLEGLEDLRNIGLSTGGAITFSLRTGASSIGDLARCDEILATIQAKQTEFGAVLNRLESVLDEISIQYDNLVSSRSTIRDADIAEESATYIQQQILQQASATLLATANQSPSIALQLI